MNKIIEKIEGIIKKELFLEKVPGGYKGVICADYRDELSKDTLLKISEEKNPRDAFYEEMMNIYDDIEEYSYIINTIKENWDNKEEYKSNCDFIADWINENIFFEPDYNHFLNRSVCVNILLDTGDGNYDYTLNNFASYNSDKNETIDNKSSILWLVKNQGYNKTQLNKAIKKQDYNGSVFLESVYDECSNVTTHMNALTFLIEMTLGEFLDILENKEDILLSKKSTCGLVDIWGGAGGLLNIALEKDVIVPRKYANIFIDGGRGYEVADIYGLSNDAWGDTMLKTIKKKNIA